MTIELEITEVLTGVTTNDKVHVVNQGDTLLFQSESGTPYFTLTKGEEFALEARMKRWYETGSFDLGAE
jgi:hypothetical protein